MRVCCYFRGTFVVLQSFFALYYIDSEYHKANKAFTQSFANAEG